MTDEQALVLSQDLADMATLIAKMLNDLTLDLSESDVKKLQSDSNKLTTTSRAIATAGALAALNAAQEDFSAMVQATASANAVVTRNQSNAAKVNGILNVLGAAITFGTTLLSGPLGLVLTAAGALKNAAAAINT